MRVLWDGYIALAGSTYILPPAQSYCNVKCAVLSKAGQAIIVGLF